MEPELPEAEKVEDPNVKTSRQALRPYLDGNLLKYPGGYRKARQVPAYLMSADVLTLRTRQDYKTNVETCNIVKHLIRIKSAAQNKEKTDNLMSIRRKKKLSKYASKRAERGIFTEAARKGMMESGATPDRVENVVDFVGETSKSANNVAPITDISTGTENTSDISRFFDRYITIYDSTWAAATDKNVAINPWDLWSKDNTIRAKLSHYAYFKGTLEIKIAVSGTPFHLGMLMASYQAYPSANQVLVAYDDLLVSTVPTSDNILPCYKSYLSQSPHVAYINIRENEPVTLKIPMILPKNRAKLYNSSSGLISSATAFEDFEEMGEIRLVTLNHINVANEDYTAAASIHVSARMIDVELGALTSTNIDITAEGRRRRRKPTTVALDMIDEAEELIEDDIDEDIPAESNGPPSASSWWSTKTANKPAYDSSLNWKQRVGQTVTQAGNEYAEPGPVSSIATAVSNVGEALSDVPIIGSFAKATSSVAKGVGKVASWFGFSKPLVLEKAVLIKNEPFSNGAQLSGFDTAKKLSCDPKQELSIDPGIAGMDGKDAMAIKEIISRESFIHTFIWADTDAAMQDVLWEGMLTPFYRQKCTSAGGKSLYQPTPMAWVADLFKYWRGSLTFRFEIVASQYHRGKLLFKFEPNAEQITLISSDSVQLNQQYTATIDIQEVQDFEVTVKYTADRAFKSTAGGNLRADVAYDQNNAALDHTDFAVDNNFGVLQVYCLNELQQTTDTGVVYVNVYVKSDDMEFAVPTDYYLNSHSYTYTETEAGYKSVVLNQNKMDNSNIYDLYFGEKVESLRSVLRRYTTEMIINHDYSTAGQSRGLTISKTLYPTAKTYPSTVTTLANTNALPNLFNYLRYGFLGMRGGYRYRYYFTSDGVSRNTSIMSSQLITGNDGLITSPNLSEVRLNSAANAVVMASTLDGSVKHMQNLSGAEVEVPYYSSDLFKIAFAPDGGNSALGYNLLTDWWSGISFSFEQYVAINDKLNLVIDSASAEDFTFFYFNGAPFYSGES